uniref:Uncharacterized protein n=1 Tax=Bubo bubo TaxID=30461 RepID=A0A8C0EJZ4_BUBBB
MELKIGKVPFAMYFCVLYTKLVRNHNFELQSLNVIFSAAESGIIKVKTIAARNTDILAGNYLQCNGKNKLGLQIKMLKRCLGYV